MFCLWPKIVSELFQCHLEFLILFHTGLPGPTGPQGADGQQGATGATGYTGALIFVNSSQQMIKTSNVSLSHMLLLIALIHGLSRCYQGHILCMCGFDHSSVMMHFIGPIMHSLKACLSFEFNHFSSSLNSIAGIMENFKSISMFRALC